MREKGEVDRPKARSKVGVDTGVPGKWYGWAMGGSGIRNWELGIRVLPLQGNISLRMEAFLPTCCPAGAGERVTSIA